MRRGAVAALLSSVVLVPAAAFGAWPAAGSGVSTVAASTMTNATGFNAACASATSIRLTWTVSSDVFVEDYEILRTGANGGTNRTIRLPRADSTFLDDLLANANGNDRHTYTYTIRAGSSNHSWTTPALSAPQTLTVAAPNKGGCTQS